MFLEILKYGFLLIFFATAAIGIASIPDWIKVSEWYKKKIFTALILEVVGVIIILFNQEFINAGSKGVPTVDWGIKNWVALNEKGVKVNPKITIETKDTAIVKTLGKESYIAFKDLVTSISEDGLCIKNTEDMSLCAVKGEDLKQMGLFNAFKTAKGEITSTENYAYVKWEKPENNWKQKGSFIGPFELSIADYAEGTYYTIKNKLSNKTVFDSRKSSKNLFSVDNRIIHFLEQDNIYYLLRIAWANLQQSDKYVHIINVRMEPTIN